MSFVCPMCDKEYGSAPARCNRCGYQLSVRNRNVAGYPVVIPAYVPRKSRTTAGVLAIFLGSFGVHNFYLGYSSKATLQLFLSVLSIILFFILVCGGSIIGGLLSLILIGFLITPIMWIIGFLFGIFWLVLEVWGIIDGVHILNGTIAVDGRGVPLAK